MVSAARLQKMGVKFFREEGQLYFTAHSDLMHNHVIREIESRSELMLAKMPKDGFVPLIRITNAPEKRWGACLCCDEEIPSNTGGMCPLCCGGLKLALKKRGRDWKIPTLDVVRSIALCRKLFSVKAIMYVIKERGLPLPPDEASVSTLLLDSDACKLSSEIQTADDGARLRLWESLIFTEEGDPVDVVALNGVSRHE